MHFYRFMGALLLVACVVSPVFSQDPISQGNDQLAKGEFESALGFFEKALKADSNSFAARLGAGRSWLGMGDHDSAVFHSTRAEKLQPKSLDAAVLSGRCFRAMGTAKMSAQEDPRPSFEEAVVSFTRASELDPKNAEWHGQVGWLRYNSMLYAESAEAYSRADALDSSNGVWASLAASSYLQTDDSAKGLAIAERGLKASPKSAALQIVIGHLHKKMGSPKKAASSFVAALVGSLPIERSDEVAGYIWQCFYNEKDWPSMSEHYGDWAKGAKNFQSHWWWGYSLFKGGHHDAAIAAYKKMDKLHGGKWAMSNLRIGEVLAAQNKVLPAAKEYKLAAARESRWAAGSEPITMLRQLIHQCWVAGGQGANEHSDLAIRVAQEYALPMAPSYMRYLIAQDIGFFCRDRGARLQRSSQKKANALFKLSRDNYDKAVKWLDSTQGVPDKTRAQIINDLGLMYWYYDVQDMETAVKLYKRALAYDSECDDAVLNYARILMRLNRTAEADDLLKHGSQRQDLQLLRAQVKRRLQEK